MHLHCIYLDVFVYMLPQSVESLNYLYQTKKNVIQCFIAQCKCLYVLREVF